VGDSFVVLFGVKANAVVKFLSWAAFVWDKNRRFSGDDLCGHHKSGLAVVLKIVRDVALVFVLHVPKIIHKSQSLDVSRDEGFGCVEIENITIDG
jgi:hypothetical protein